MQICIYVRMSMTHGMVWINARERGCGIARGIHLCMNVCIHVCVEISRTHGMRLCCWSGTHVHVHM